jgi:pimeloyl-ACP methyl ester carboxylesterase
VLIGHSLGGSMVAEATALLSDVIVAVVGIDTWSGLEVEASTQTDEDQEQRLAAFETDFRGYVEPWLRRMFHPSSDPQLVDRIVKDMVSRDQRMGLSAMKYAGTHTAKFQQRMRALRVPAYLIAADGSLYPKDPAAAGRYGIGFEMMTGVGHFPMLEAPQRFNARLDSVLDNLLS